MYLRLRFRLQCTSGIFLGYFCLWLAIPTHTNSHDGTYDLTCHQAGVSLFKVPSPLSNPCPKIVDFHDKATWNGMRGVLRIEPFPRHPSYTQQSVWNPRRSTERWRPEFYGLFVDHPHSCWRDRQTTTLRHLVRATDNSSKHILPLAPTHMQTPAFACTPHTVHMCTLTHTHTEWYALTATYGCTSAHVYDDWLR